MNVLTHSGKDRLVDSPKLKEFMEAMSDEDTRSVTLHKPGERVKPKIGSVVNGMIVTAGNQSEMVVNEHGYWVFADDHG